MRDIARSAVVAATLLLWMAGPVATAADPEMEGERHPDRWDGTVTARSLNIRAGPGEGYPIVGKLRRGDGIVAVDESGRWVRLEGIGDGKTEAWAYRAFVRLPENFMAPALGDEENAFVDWAAERGDLAEFSIDGSRRLSIVLAAQVDEAAARDVAREIGCEWRERLELEETVTVTVWPEEGPLAGWVTQATCP